MEHPISTLDIDLNDLPVLLEIFDQLLAGYKQLYYEQYNSVPANLALQSQRHDLLIRADSFRALQVYDAAPEVSVKKSIFEPTLTTKLTPAKKTKKLTNST